MVVQSDKDGSYVILGTTLLYTLQPGDDWVWFQDKLIIANPNHPTFILNADGTRTIINPLSR